MTDAFDLTFVTLDGGRIRDIEEINTAIERLASRRKETIKVEGAFAKSKIAWKAGCYQQAILWRTVMLAYGAREAWNDQNFLPCFLCVRAFVETIAVFDSFALDLAIAVGRADLKAMDDLVMNRTFATKTGELLNDHPELIATNVLTFVDKLGKKYDLPIRENYDRLSERCHPNSAGHHQMYSSTDYSDATVTFSKNKDPSMTFDYICAPLGLVFLFERTMDHLDETIVTLAEVHHKISPSPLHRP